jgi:hypothetical protein
MSVASNATATQPPLEPLKAEPGQDGMLNRLLRWVDRLPIPYPVFCLGVWVGCTVLFQGMLAFSTHQPPWPLNLNSTLNAFVLAYCLGLTLHVQRSVRQSLAAFAPVLDLDQEGYARLRAELVSIPTRPALLCGLLVVLTALVGNYLLGSNTIRAALSVAPIMISSAAVVSLTYGVVGILMYNLIRKLWLIGRIYPLAGRLDLNNHRSLYAFSGLTARIWAGWIVLSYPSVLLMPDVWRNPAWMTVTGLTLFVISAGSCYALLHIHRRIGAEKQRMLFDVQTRLQDTFTRLHEHMDRGSLQDLGPLKVLMDSLVLERGVLEKVSTWPWQSETLAGFSSVVLLPLAIWLVQTWIKKLAGL